jgi:two-component system sensor histidine kinase BaeS
VAVAPGTGRFGELEDRFLRGVNRLLLVASLGAGIMAAMIGLLFAQRLTQPLQALTSAAHRLAAPRRHAAIRLPVTSGDEVGTLTAAFNQMSAELSKQENLRRHMVADIAHELRTPLSVLRMELEGLEDGVVAPSREALASLKEEVNLLNRLVDDLNLLALAEAEQLGLTMTEVEPAAVVERVAALAATRARWQEIDLRVEVAPDLPPVCADEQRLIQVLSNLVDNALRYTPAGGTVTLGSSISTPPGEVWFSVHDTGPGIPPDELERIFERFYRTDRARARETGGSGLGLAIVRSLVEAMSGRVWAESPPQQGTIFIVALHCSNV